MTPHLTHKQDTHAPGHSVSARISPWVQCSKKPENINNSSHTVHPVDPAHHGNVNPQQGPESYGWMNTVISLYIYIYIRL